MPQEKPALAVACLLFNQGRILLSQRPKTPQQNSWQCPGGFVQMNESLEAAGKRILQQKLAVSLKLSSTCFYSNNIFKTEQQHTFTLYLSASCPASLIKSEKWQWFALEQLPQPLFLPLQILFSQQSEKLMQFSRTQRY